MLPWCSEIAIGIFLDNVIFLEEETGGAVLWEVVAMRHPKLAFDRLELRVTQSTGWSKSVRPGTEFFQGSINRTCGQVIVAMGAMLPILANNDANRLLDLVAKLQKPVSDNASGAGNGEAVAKIAKVLGQLRRANPEKALPLLANMVMASTSWLVKDAFEKFDVVRQNKRAREEKQPEKAVPIKVLRQFYLDFVKDWYDQVVDKGGGKGCGSGSTKRFLDKIGFWKFVKFLPKQQRYVFLRECISVRLGSTEKMFFDAQNICYDHLKIFSDEERRGIAAEAITQAHKAAANDSKVAISLNSMSMWNGVLWRAGEDGLAFFREQEQLMTSSDLCDRSQGWQRLLSYGCKFSAKNLDWVITNKILSMKNDQPDVHRAVWESIGNLSVDFLTEAHLKILMTLIEVVRPKLQTMVLYWDNIRQCHNNLAKNIFKSNHGHDTHSAFVQFGLDIVISDIVVFGSTNTLLFHPLVCALAELAKNAPPNAHAKESHDCATHMFHAMLSENFDNDANNFLSAALQRHPDARKLIRENRNSIFRLLVEEKTKSK